MHSGLNVTSLTLYEAKASQRRKKNQVEKQKLLLLMSDSSFDCCR